LLLRIREAISSESNTSAKSAVNGKPRSILISPKQAFLAIRAIAKHCLQHHRMGKMPHSITTNLSLEEFLETFLKQGTMTQSEALRQAQLSMVKNTSPQNYSHPYYWAPFVLIGNGF
jgi:hypothetical protein